MSDPEPTIRAESCRGDGRCPECGAPSEFLHLLPCGCKPCMLWPCALEHLDRLLTESLRQLSEQRHPCPCGKDTASIKWARCYSCRQQEAEERERIAEERDAAIRENTAAMAVLREHLSGEYTDLADAVRNLAQAYVSECGNADAAIRQRDLAQGWLAKQLEDPEFRRLYSQKLEEETRKERERAEKAEALLARAHLWVAQEAAFSASPATRERAGALAIEIREALPK